MRCFGHGGCFSGVRLLSILLLLSGLLSAPAAHGQTPGGLLAALRGGQLEITRLTGRSPGFFEPMIELEARNLTERDLTVDVPVGTILKAVDRAYCDVVVLRPEERIAFSAGEHNAVRFYLYGYCLQLTPMQARFPSNQATYLVSSEAASPAVQAVLERVQARELERSRAAQLAVWMVQHGYSGLSAMENALGSPSWSGYSMEVLALLGQDAVSGPRATGALTPVGGEPVPAVTAAGAPTASPGMPASDGLASASLSAMGSAWPLLVGVTLLIAFAVFLAIVARRRLRGPRRAAPITAPMSMTHAAAAMPMPGLHEDHGRAVITHNITYVIDTTPALGGRTSSTRQASAPLEVVLREVATGERFVAPANGGVFSRAGSGVLRQIVVAGPAVGAPHACLELTPGAAGGVESAVFTIKDLRSRTGTWVDGKPVSAAVSLRDSAVITLGETTLRFYARPKPRLVDPETGREDLLEGTNRWLITGREMAIVSLDRLHDRMISAPHAYIEVLQDRILLKDLNSTNGTLLHGQGINEVHIVPDDVLQFGQTLFEVSTNLDYMPATIDVQDQPGERLRKVGLIREGGMARVYQYRRERDGAPFAVKAPRIGKYRRTDRSGTDYRRAYEQELHFSRAIADRRDRPVHVDFALAEWVQAIEIPYVGAIDCLIMEYVDGVSLANIPKEAQLEGPAQVASSLAFLHEQLGLVHCDVKPANILLDRAGNIVLTDFGIASRLGEPLGPFMSPGYWPPEAVSGDARRATPQVDIYSLGVTLYEIVTGARLVDYPAQDWPQRALDYASTFPADPDLGRIIARCLQVDPEKRYASAAMLAADLTPLRQPWVELGELVDRATPTEPRRTR
jgi:pSer/pThr/pTyr-binding forkhead associated (FHA) protein